ncbi:CitMHS family citrate-Mg2+:H+ or citrate-Ca2+:H+ symporter [Saonia flava]|uniref:CitMHS family citrate-Mg2+:H+ or citrate-Ca2+:H+ symporter n=1 Tax=Saonia flava TaxID=523696 RepID=A0A846QUH2_9FLAO|nr:citrate:proton symporter [Saonia flava]NJB70192.1 CitMHS family citrate-Mg2+:H+ or citrate-Ca2+:H+ symporter [Saonia flava]
MILYTGLGITILLLALILSKKVSALTALILVPIAGSLLAGFGLETATFAVEGIKNIAPVVAMFVFAILFFGVLTDAGMFDPIINTILRLVGHNPSKITIGTAVLAMIVHLDGSGAVTFLIAIPAMLPLFEKLQMDRRVLACVVALGAGTMNLVPWGGPTIRAATALQVEITDLYTPVMIPQLFGLLFVILVAWYLGKKEAKRLKIDSSKHVNEHYSRELSYKERQLRRPNLFWFNITLTILVITTLVSGKIAPALVFMLGAIIALTVNYSSLSEQKKRIDAHAKASLLMASILLAAGVFTGIMKESGMISEMANAAANVIPQSAGQQIPVIMAVAGMPLSMVFDPDSFYFGFLPVIAEVAGQMGVAQISVGQAAILGQMTTGFPLSPLTATTFLLIGLAKVDLAEHQRFTFKYAFATTIVMALVAILIGVIPI